MCSSWHDFLFVNLCTRKGHFEVATQLLGHKIDARVKKISNGATALHLACRHGNIDIAKRILQSGAYMEAKMIAMVEDPDKGDNESQVILSYLFF